MLVCPTLQIKLPEMSGDPAPTMPQLFVAGGTAGFMYWVLFYPLDVLKSAMQTDALIPAERKYRSLGHAASSLWAEGGVARFYKGVTPCLLRAVPANAVMLGVVVRSCLHASCAVSCPLAAAALTRIGTPRADQGAHDAGAVSACGVARACCSYDQKDLGTARALSLQRPRSATGPAARRRRRASRPRRRARAAPRERTRAPRPCAAAPRSARL